MVKPAQAGGAYAQRRKSPSLSSMPAVSRLSQPRSSSNWSIIRMTSNVHSNAYISKLTHIRKVRYCRFQLRLPTRTTVGQLLGNIHWRMPATVSRRILVTTVTISLIREGKPRPHPSVPTRPSTLVALRPHYCANRPIRAPASAEPPYASCEALIMNRRICSR